MIVPTLAAFAPSVLGAFAGPVLESVEGTLGGEEGIFSK